MLHMKRIWAIAGIVVLLVLPACGEVQAEPETSIITTTEAVTVTTAATEEITEEETTTRAAVIGGDISWRILDLEDKANADIKTWTDDWLDKREASHLEDRPSEYPMGNGKTLITDYTPPYRILLRDDKTGTETLLLKGKEELYYEELDYFPVPILQHVLDERFILVIWSAYESFGEYEIFDTQEMKSIPMDVFAVPCMITDDTLYMHNARDYDEPVDGEVFLLVYDLNALRHGGTLSAVNLLADIPHEEAGDLLAFELTKDERYFIATDWYGVYVFDIKEKTLPLYLPKTSLGVPMHEWCFNDIAVRDEHIVYAFSSGLLPSHFYGADYLLELTLP